jgi:hypothetical protein
MPFERGSRVGTWLALLAGGVIGVLAVAGCGSGSPSSSPAATTSGAPGSSSAASPAATATPLPSWASALGGSVTVVAPHPASPGYGSPGAVVQGLFAAISSKHYADECAYGQPSAQATCRSEASQVSASQMPYYSNFAVGYVVIDGDKAAVGITGTFCVPGQSPECFTNDDPAAVFSTAKSFAALWANAITPSSGYSLTPCVEIDRKWYLYSSSS